MKKKKVGKKKFNAKDYVNTKEAADMLGLSYKTLINWRSLGKGPRYYKLGNKRSSSILYKRNDIKKYIESQSENVYFIETSST